MWFPLAVPVVQVLLRLARHGNSPVDLKEVSYARVTQGHAYPPNAVKKVTEVFLSPELPKRPEYAKELASFVYADNAGYHSMILLDVEDSKLADYIRAQTERNVYMQSRVEGLAVEVNPGMSVMDAIALTSKHMPK